MKLLKLIIKRGNDYVNVIGWESLLLGIPCFFVSMFFMNLIKIFSGISNIPYFGNFFLKSFYFIFGMILFYKVAYQLLNIEERAKEKKA